MYLEDFSLEMSFTVPPTVVSKDEILEFSRKYDPFPLHMDEEYAKSTRFGGLIAPGVLSFMIIWARFLEQNPFGDELVAGKSTKIEWFKPVYAGDILTASVRVTGIKPRNAYNGIVEMIFNEYNQNGELVLTNVTETVVKRKK